MSAKARRIDDLMGKMRTQMPSVVASDSQSSEEVPPPNSELSVTDETSVSPPSKSAAPRTRLAKDNGASAGRHGKPVQFWLQEEDRRLIRELAAWLSGQGVRATDTGVVRAALSFAKTGPDYLKIYRQVTQLDGRLPPYRKP